MEVSTFNVDQDLFSGKKNGEVLTLSFKEKPLLHITDLSVKKTLFDYLDLVACCNEIKVLLLKESPAKILFYKYFHHHLLQLHLHFLHHVHRHHMISNHISEKLNLVCYFL